MPPAAISACSRRRPALTIASTDSSSIDKVLEVDQKPLGKSSRSNPATYIGAFDEIRKLFAATRLAKIRGYKANRFSFNAKGGRCEECQGQGSVRVELAFMPDLRVPCPVCQGKRFNAGDAGGALSRPVDRRRARLADRRGPRRSSPTCRLLQRGLQALDEVGLGYLALGQPASTLSGGEAQRVKLAAELAKTATGKTLYLFDEPTTGLHFVDVARLIRVFRRLVDAGNTVVVIEHHLDLIAAARLGDRPRPRRRRRRWRRRDRGNADRGGSVSKKYNREIPARPLVGHMANKTWPCTRCHNLFLTRHLWHGPPHDGHFPGGEGGVFWLNRDEKWTK